MARKHALKKVPASPAPESNNQATPAKLTCTAKRAALTMEHAAAVLIGIARDLRTKGNSPQADASHLLVDAYIIDEILNRYENGSHLFDFPEEEASIIGAIRGFLEEYDRPSEPGESDERQAA